MRFFSHSYLEQILPQRSDWQQLASAAVPTMRQIAQICADDQASENESHSWEQRIRSVLLTLGHELDVQSNQIVYLLQPWDHPLDTLLINQERGPRIPSVQIAIMMRQRDTEWGILTNGRLWRLYHQDSVDTLEHFYQVDLPTLLTTDDPTAFLYFYIFFRRTAFENQPLGVAALLCASADAAQRLSDLLKDQTLLAVRHIAQGLLDDEQNQHQPDDATLKMWYAQSLRVVCRLLFRRFATARNGSGFESNSYRLPQDLHISDARLQDAVDLLTYVVGTTTEIGYRDIPERYLGTLYEGLLAYHLEVTRRDTGWMVALVNNPQQRKASGSYYTPDAIVAQIVDNTVGPALRHAVADCDDDEARVRAILAVTICDPAMGSGHFLVEATNYVARFLVEMGIMTDDRRPTADDQNQALDSLPLAPFVLGPSSDSDLVVWKRRVVQSCIYGVDLDPLAVELATWALWFATRSNDQPRTFLDHRLRCGNALIGAQIADLEDGELVQSMRIPDSGQAQGYANLQAALGDTYGRRANLTTARYFGLRERVKHTNGSTDALSTQADIIAQERRFLHWELTFPEIFFTIDGRSEGDGAGFDVIIGNPPYMTTLTQEDRQYFNTWSQTRGRELDLFALFIEQGLRLTRSAGWCGMIVPNVWMAQTEGEALRRYLLAHTMIVIIDYGFSAFGAATVPTATFVCRKQPPDQEHGIHIQTASGADRYMYQRVIATLPDAQFNPKLLDMLPTLEKIQAISDPLAHIARSHEGIHSGNSKDTLFTRQLDAVSAKKMLKGADIRRYALDWGGWYVRYDRSLINTTAGAYAALREESLFTQPKIWTRQTSDRIIATYDEQGFYSDNTLHSTQLHANTQISPYFVTAILNSRLLSYIYQERTQERGRPLAQVKLVFLRQLPIRRIDFITPQAQRDALQAQGSALYVNQEYRALLNVAGAQLASQPERCDAVHDVLDYLAQQMIVLSRTRQQALQALRNDLDPNQLAQLERLYTPPTAPKAASRDYRARQIEFTARYEIARAHLGDLAVRRLTLRDDIGALSEAQWNWLIDQRLHCDNQSDLLALYRRHQPAIAALDRRIADTDKLIDQIVYALYGLGDDEITMIEKR